MELHTVTVVTGSLLRRSPRPSCPRAGDTGASTLRARSALLRQTLQEVLVESHAASARAAALVAAAKEARATSVALRTRDA